MIRSWRRCSARRRRDAERFGRCVLGYAAEEAAQEHRREAEDLLTPFWRRNSAVHGDQMARILLLQAILRESSNVCKEACGLASRALAAAYDLSLKEEIQAFIERCAAGEAGAEGEAAF